MADSNTTAEVLDDIDMKVGIDLGHIKELNRLVVMVGSHNITHATCEALSEAIGLLVERVETTLEELRSGLQETSHG